MIPTIDLQTAAHHLADAVEKVGRDAATEEDVRVGVSMALQPVMTQLGLTTEPRFEAGVRLGETASGRADAIYGAVYLEYKAPGRLASRAERHRAVEQLQRYLEHADQARAGSRRLVGALTDAKTIVFVRQRPAHRVALDFYDSNPSELTEAWYVSDQLPIGVESVAQLLHFLRSLSRQPLTPTALGRTFGPDGDVAPALIGALYARLTAEPTPLTQTLFAEWDRIFGIVYGQDLPRATRGAAVLGELYGVEQPELKRLFFAVHTYYALVMKLLAVEVASLQQGSYITSFVEEVSGLDDRQFEEKLEALEDGSEFRRLEITNYLEGDLFRWYLAEWDDEIRALVRRCVATLERFEPHSGFVEPDQARDLLKHLYQYLVPKQLRHDLGEYYTPDWLAEEVLNRSGYEGNPAERILDPACGSGTFQALEIARVIEYGEEHLVDQRALAEAIVRNVVAFDINPLSVLAARTTYLLSLGHLLRYVRPLEIPVYLCDSIVRPSVEGGGLFSQGRRLQSSVGAFVIPSAIDTAPKMAAFAESLERAVRERHSIDGLQRTIERSLGSEMVEADRQLLLELFERLLELQEEGRNGIWPRIIKNQFAPLFVADDRFDYVIGNPPWVNWESLSDDYRRTTRALWASNGLFSLRGHAARLGGGKKDLSMLMTYAAADHYLRDGGTLAFLITQTVFKSEDAGRGFRRFTLADTTPLRVEEAHDLSALQPFEGASNRTAFMVITKGLSTEYPVRWVRWTSSRTRPSPDALLEHVLAHTDRTSGVATPVDDDDSLSPWLTAAPEEIQLLRAALGESTYRAHAGSYTGGLNGAFWVEVLARRTDGTVLIRNIRDDTRRETPLVKMAIEPDLLFPLLRGRDVRRWTGRPSASIVLAQDPVERIGYGETWLRDNLPLTHAYLSRFREPLLARGSRVVQDLMERGAFYSMYGIGQYTVAPWKVVWREQASSGQLPELIAAAIGPHDGRSVIPDHKLLMVACESEQEAHYLAAVLNSSLPRRIVAAYAPAVGISTSVMQYVRIPRFDGALALHQNLAEMGSEAHSGEAPRAEELDDLVAHLW